MPTLCHELLYEVDSNPFARANWFNNGEREKGKCNRSNRDSLIQQEAGKEESPQSVLGLPFTLLRLRAYYQHLQPPRMGSKGLNY